MSDWPVVVLTAALVLVTGYYAWQNRQMVKEMRAARTIAVMPKLAITMTHIGPDLWFPTIVNVGPGAALDVDVEIALEPGAGDYRRWRSAVMAPPNVTSSSSAGSLVKGWSTWLTSPNGMKK